MRTIKQMVDWLLGEKRSPEIRRGPHTVTTGIVRVGSNLELCWAHDKRRGVKLVAITAKEYERWKEIELEYRVLQSKLKELPKSRRPRKRKLKIISLPPNPQNAIELRVTRSVRQVEGHAAAIEGKA